ncbi:geranyl transferase [Lentilactobacillus curieae]|uniref:Farnesyl diphosphate synthase n=1 Tax=Lentilactobacillus curieae TaxID=1138822 RepID=A0A1S6QK98_9LACO|nr:farnesyl diphosphate synthase [Lentilactobacillus curieae]AQW22003.1 geranyl transferase [Lentilactobacillus curieae]
MAKIKQFEQEWIPKIDHLLDSQMNYDVSQPELLAAMKYSVDAGGKRFRPLLGIATVLTVNKQVGAVQLKALSAIELLHTYSLIHDDLPAMDDDPIRRGKPSNHIKFGDALATLAGDGLQALAFQWVVDNQLPSTVKSELALKLAIAAGPAGMVAGQADDVLNENHELSYDALKKLHRNKTGALIHYAVESGLIVGGVNEADRKPFLEFADAFGLAFQIYDDILDVISNERELGKPVHQDSGKNTYPNLFGLSKSKEILAITVSKAMDALDLISDEQGFDTKLLKEFCGYFKIEEIE